MMNPAIRLVWQLPQQLWMPNILLAKDLQIFLKTPFDGAELYKQIKSLASVLCAKIPGGFLVKQDIKL